MKEGPSRHRFLLSRACAQTTDSGRRWTCPCRPPAKVGRSTVTVCADTAAGIMITQKQTVISRLNVSSRGHGCPPDYASGAASSSVFNRSDHSRPPWSVEIRNSRASCLHGRPERCQLRSHRCQEKQSGDYFVHDVVSLHLNPVGVDLVADPLNRVFSRHRVIMEKVQKPLTDADDALIGIGDMMRRSARGCKPPRRAVRSPGKSSANDRPDHFVEFVSPGTRVLE